MAFFPARFLLHPFFLFGVLLLLSAPLLSEGSHESLNYHVLDVQSLLQDDAACSSPKGTGTTNHTAGRLRIVHRHGHQAKSSPSLPQLLSQDEARANSIRTHRHRHRHQPTTAPPSPHLKPSDQTAASPATLPSRSGRSLGTGNYVVTVGLGTPKKDQTVVFDTGSDLTWVQCQPCTGGCYSQQDPIFDPAQSASYSNVSCPATDCAALSSATTVPTRCSAGKTCLYGIQYGDSSFSVGLFARDNLTLSSDAIPGFMFGCGQKNTGLFGRTSGLLGLGRHPVSVVSQTKNKYGGAFSYCLPSTSTGTGYLSFGVSPSYGSAVQYTPMRLDQTPESFYFLDLTAIKVGGQLLPIAPTVFQTAGALIDSGTVITRLPPAAYTALRTAFRLGMTKYPAAPAVSILDTCFDLTGYTTVVLPTVELVFKGGASLKVAPSGILIAATQAQICLAFAGNGGAADVGIIGNTQQKTYTVVHDVSKAVIGFAPGGCS